MSTNKSGIRLAWAVWDQTKKIERCVGQLQNELFSGVEAE